MCECSPQCGSVFAQCSLTLRENFFTGATTITGGPQSVQLAGGEVAYTFNGRNDISNNWLEIESALKSRILQVTDDFSISMWLNLDTTSGAQYIYTFESGTQRYFTLFDNSGTRAIFYYFRDVLPGLSPNDDDGYISQVALSFYYDTAVFPRGLRDGQWHFITLNIDYPSVTFVVDGYEYRPTQGNYRDSFRSRVLLSQDGTFYNMPAPILTKSTAQIDSIIGRIGGSARGNRFSMGGQLRQLSLTNLLTSQTFNCLASCNNRIYPSPTASVVSSFTTFYNPVSRVFTFSGALTPTVYTLFLQSLIYSSNGFLPPEESRESRIIRLQVSEQVDE